MALEYLDWLGPALIGAFVASIAVFITRRTEQSRRQLDLELKIAEFRLKWIEDLRDDLVQFLSMTGPTSSDTQNTMKLGALFAKVKTRFKSDDASKDGLIEAMLQCMTAESAKDVAEAHSALTVAAQEILNTEWHRVLSDLSALDGKKNV